MGKIYKWEMTEVLEEGTERLHSITLKCSNLTGKALISIDGDEYDISAKPFGLRGTNQVFRLGELPAVLDFPKKGAPTVTVDGSTLTAL